MPILIFISLFFLVGFIEESGGGGSGTKKSGGWSWKFWSGGDSKDVEITAGTSYMLGDKEMSSKYILLKKPNGQNASAGLGTPAIVLGKHSEKIDRIDAYRVRIPRVAGCVDYCLIKASYLQNIQGEFKVEARRGYADIVTTDNTSRSISRIRRYSPITVLGPSNVRIDGKQAVSVHIPGNPNCEKDSSSCIMPVDELAALKPDDVIRFNQQMHGVSENTGEAPCDDNCGTDDSHGGGGIRFAHHYQSWKLQYKNSQSCPI